MVKVGKKRLFKSRSEFRKWLSDNHDSSPELWLIFYKKHTGKNTLQYDEAVEEALCFGWIDGTLKRIDDRKHIIRFSPRRKGSVWSVANIDRVNKLIKQRKMTRAGLEKFRELDETRREPTGTGESEIPDFIVKGLKKNTRVWTIFNEMAPSHRKQYVWWISEAKKEETRQRRLTKAIEMIAEKKRPGIE